MERLTHRDFSGNVRIPVGLDENGTVTLAFNRLAQYEDTMTLERAQELSQAEKDGRLVVHGMWVESDIPGSMLSKCTVCGFGCGAYTFNFCPNCGAKMDLSEEELKKRGADNETD